jgi:kynurenine formamidase
MMCRAVSRRHRPRVRAQPGAVRHPQDQLLDPQQFRELFEEVSTWGRWTSDQGPGTLHQLTPARVAAAAGEVRTGHRVSMALPLDLSAGPDNPGPPIHHMTGLADVPIGSGSLCFATDYVGMNMHGDAHTHVDALCHVVYDGIPAGTLTSAGAGALPIDVASTGLVGRGVLLDIPRARGIPWLEPGDHVTVDDLQHAETTQDVQVGPGDILCVRVGHCRRRNQTGAWDVAQSRAGLHPTAMRFLAEREVAVLGSDGNNDTAPSAVAGVPYPVHVLAINAMGLHLVDYLQLEDLTRLCQDLRRWSFFCVIAPLRLVAGTGAPVNPIAVL